MKSITKSRGTSFLLACLLVMNGLALLPLLSSGFFADDIYNSQIRGHMIQTDRSLWGVTYFYANAWLSGGGRLFPLAFYCYSVFYLLGNVVFYKAFIFCLVLGCISAYYYFLKRLANSEPIAIIAISLLPLMFQFRVGWDPILSFHASYPLIGLMLFGSFNLFLRTLDEKQSLKNLWPAVILFLCTGLIYEVVYPMFLVFFTLAFIRLHNVKAAFRVAWPFFAVTLCLVVASLIFRSQATGIGSTYKMNMDIALYIKTYLTQMLGAVPLSYYFFDPHSIFLNQPKKGLAIDFQTLFILAIAASFVVSFTYRQISTNVNEKINYLKSGIFAIGLLLLAIPSSIISLSPKFQSQALGDAYLPVFLSYFGVSLLLGGGLASLHARFIKMNSARVWMFPAALLIWLVIFILNFANNQLVVKTENARLWHPRVLLEDGLRNGLLTGINQKSILLVNGVDAWDHADEYSALTGLRFSVYRLNENRDFRPIFEAAGGSCVSTVNQQICEFASDVPIYTVQIRHLTDGTGALMLARVQKAYQANGVVSSLISNDVTAYFRLPDSAQLLTVALSGRNLKNEANADIFRQSHELNVLKQGAGWKLVSMNQNILIDALSLRGEIAVDRPESAILRMKDPGAMKLNAVGPVILHAGYEGGHLGNGMALPAIKFENEMGIEVLVKPGDYQRPHADILSNHRSDFKGLALELVNLETNLYAASFGSGKEWMTIGNFSLNPGDLNHISLQVSKGAATLHVNGLLIARTFLPAPISQSPYPFFIGNWFGGDRSFHGWIEEVIVYGNAKSEEMVLKDSGRFSSLNATQPRPPRTVLN